MRWFRIWLGLILVVVGIYTVLTISRQGINLFPYFFGDIARVQWPGQFNLDFLFMLRLSALWTAWRNGFTPSGCALGVLAFFLGAPFLAAYLLVLTARTSGDMAVVLLGPRRAGRHMDA